MKTPLFKNNEFRFVLAGAIILCCITILLHGLLLQKMWDDFRQILVERDLAVLGALLEHHPAGSDPAVEALIIQAFTQQETAGTIQKGLKAAARYGYTPELPLSSLKLLNAFYQRTVVNSTLAFFALVLGILLLLFIIFQRLYRRLNELSLGAERAMRGDFSMRFPEEGEGELPLLGFQFNQLAYRLQRTFDVTLEEKKMLKEMVTGISHQLKTPLASTRMFTELLLESADEDPVVREEFLKKSLSQLERMEWLIQTLLKMSRLEAGVITLNRQDTNLTSTVAAVMESLSVLALDKHQQLNFHPLEDPVMVLHDARWLAEAVENVIKNAVLYTPEGGLVDVSLFEHDATVGLTIADNGPGIPPEELSRIFDRFYQGQSSTGARVGSGIGLSLAKLIIELHGGVIQAANRTMHGAVFTITLPKISGPI